MAGGAAERAGLRKGDRVLVDLAADLLVPPLSWVVLGALVLFGAAAGLSVWQGHAAWSLGAAGACLFALGAYVMRGWWVSEQGVQGLFALARAPFYVAWKLWLVVSRPEEKKGEWVRTTREGTKP